MTPEQHANVLAKLGALDPEQLLCVVLATRSPTGTSMLDLWGEPLHVYTVAAILSQLTPPTPGEINDAKTSATCH